MEHPVKAAPCPLLFAANGGRFSRMGLPILGSTELSKDALDAISSKERPPAATAALLCDKAFDCGTCPLLHEWVAHEASQGWTASWECNGCVSHKEPSVHRRFAGFYQSGRGGYPEDDYRHDPDNPPLDGCMACGCASSLLQLVLRKPR